MDDAQFALRCQMRTVSVGHGEAVVSMPAEGNRNAMGVVHGGAVFGLADQAFALASNSYGDRQVGLVSSISYLRPARGDLVAAAKLVSETKRTSLYSVEVTDNGRLVAVFQGTGYRLEERR